VHFLFVLRLCTFPCVLPCLWTHPRFNRVISSKHNIFLLLIGRSSNANLPHTDVHSDTLSSGILRLTHLDYSWVHHRILFSDAGDTLTYLIQSSLPLPFLYWCTVSTLSLRFCVWYNIVASLHSIPENPREWFFVWSLQYFNMHTMLLAACSVCQAFSLPSGKITLACNNLGILLQLHYPKETISCSCKHTDLLQACHNLLHSLPVQVSLVHVWGHQDSLLPFAALDCLVQLNSMAWQPGQATPPPGYLQEHP